jgi:hypothetical protein
MMDSEELYYFFAFRIAVCVKGMAFANERSAFPSPTQMLEWLELQYALGADSVTIYIYDVPRRLLDLLESYASIRSKKSEGRRLTIVN